MGRHLVVMHIDGLGADSLEQELRDGDMPFKFVFAKRDWGIDASNVRGAHEIHPILCALRDRLAASQAFRSSLMI